MLWDDFFKAVQEAENTLRQADQAANKMAQMLRGRLRKVDSRYLKELKRELQDFDAAKKQWKEKK